MESNTNAITKKVVYTSLFAAMVFVATVVIHIHIPVAGAYGYINFGDCAVLICGILLGPVYGGLAAGIGSALTDALYGHMLYVPGTFVIKGLMAVVAFAVYRALSRDKNAYKIFPLAISSVASELVMVGGYFFYEGIVYSFSAAALAVIPNCMQGLSGIVLCILLLKLMKKAKLTDKIKL